MRDLHYVIADPKGSCMIESAKEIVFEKDMYPTSLASIHLPISDLCHSQAFFTNEHNFSPTSRFDVLLLNTDGSLHWIRDVDDASLSPPYPVRWLDYLPM